jgi:hypothetical protein
MVSTMLLTSSAFAGHSDDDQPVKQIKPLRVFIKARKPEPSGPRELQDTVLPSGVIKGEHRPRPTNPLTFPISA